MPKYWHCNNCATRNDRTGGRRKCVGCGKAAPKVRVPKHAEALRDTPYASVVVFSARLHGTYPEACGVCGKPRGEARKHERDHDHRTGHIRGLACYNCNNHLLRHETLESLRAAVAYLERCEAHYAREASVV